MRKVPFQPKIFPKKTKTTISPTKYYSFNPKIPDKLSLSFPYHALVKNIEISHFETDSRPENKKKKKKIQHVSVGTNQCRHDAHTIPS